jgi:hypothetical protein
MARCHCEAPTRPGTFHLVVILEVFGGAATLGHDIDDERAMNAWDLVHYVWEQPKEVHGTAISVYSDALNRKDTLDI